MSFRVVAVDDDWAVTRMIRMNLENQDIQVAEVSTGLDCLKRVCEHGADLILLDLRLPDLDGWGILGLLRMTHSLHHIPVIVVSVEPPDAACMRQFQPDDYIQKPFDIRDLLARAKRLIGQRHVPGRPGGRDMEPAREEG